jgi:ubiquitin-protein ligase
MKEYSRLMKNPTPNIEAHPLEHNVLEWHFVFTCIQQPYVGGEYHGVLEFPPESVVLCLAL